MSYTRIFLTGYLLVLAWLVIGCQPDIAINTEEELGQAFQTTIDEAVSKNDNIRNAVLMVAGPDFTWQGAAGLADPEAEITMLPDDQFRSASSAKMMLATLTVKLAEADMIDLDAPIADYLAADIIDGLHVFEGQDSSATITTRQLLQHVTGIADDWFDERDEGRFFQLVTEEETDKLWDPVELVDYVKDNLPPLFLPGEGLSYSDVNYVLAGLVIEAATGQPLHEVYREQLFEPLGMAHTYMEFREPARPSIPNRGISHVYYEDLDYTSFRSLSADWAGGGLATTATDMTRFIRAFVDNEIFADPATREQMMDWAEWQGEQNMYGLGIIRSQGQRFTLWGHTGVGQSFMLYWPDGDITITGTLNQEEAELGPVILFPVLEAMTSFQE